VRDTAAQNDITRLEVDAETTCVAPLPNGRLVAGDSLGRLHWLEIMD
jgi:hypothetical protein